MSGNAVVHGTPTQCCQREHDLSTSMPSLPPWAPRRNSIGDQHCDMPPRLLTPAAAFSTERQPCVQDQFTEFR